jgi:ABC-type transport system involved in multi-copper enzyme maturation permease subunit
MLPIIRYTLITAVRDLLFIGLLAIIIIATLVSYLLGSTALTEQQQMTIAYIAGSNRIILMIGLIIFVCFHVRRFFENKEIEMILSRPISRLQFILSYWAAFALIAFLLTLALSIIMSLYSSGDFLSLCYWSLSILCESLMMIAFAMVTALIFGSAVTSALSSLSFYFVCRMMGFFAVALQNKPLGSIPTQLSDILTWLSEVVLLLISTILPRLDLFAKTSWLVYGITDLHDWLIVPIQSAIYLPILLLVAIFDFKNKQF